MTSYILRNIDPQLWAKVKARADKQGHTVRWILMQLLSHYAAHGLTGLSD